MIFLVVFLGGVFWLEESFQEEGIEQYHEISEPIIYQLAEPIIEETPSLSTGSGVYPERSEGPPRNDVLDDILLGVPFICQAPFGQWDEPVFQNACEEASILMAMRWVENKSLTKEEATKEIIAISDFELKNYGHFIDHSAADTGQLIKDYFEYENVEVQFNISAEDIKSELVQGNLVIAPVNGQKIGNPFYTPPGPLRHMVVIIGYNFQTKEFITNDAGTRRGQNYRYPENVLEQALQDYLTGDHEPISQIKKAMIVVRP